MTTHAILGGRHKNSIISFGKLTTLLKEREDAIYNEGYLDGEKHSTKEWKNHIKLLTRENKKLMEITVLTGNPKGEKQ